MEVENSTRIAAEDTTNTDQLHNHDDADDSTTILFIPYAKFTTIPHCEMRKIKEEATLAKTEPQLFWSLQSSLGVDISAVMEYWTKYLIYLFNQF